MQVLPIIDNIIKTYDASEHSAKSGGAFSDMFHQAQSMVKNPLDSTVNVVREQAVKRPDDITGSRDMRLDTKELNQLRETLRAKGVSDQSLEQINELLANGQMPTLGQIFNSLRNGGLPVDLSDADKKNITSVLQKIGFSPDEAEYLQGVMADGQGKSVWQAINQRIANMAANGESSDFFQDEMASLVKGMGGSGKLLNGLENIFQGRDTLTLDALGLKTALGGLSGEVAQKIADEGKIAKHLQAALRDAAENIKERQTKETLSDKRGSRNVERSEYLMRDKATAKANGLSEAPAKGGAQEGRNGPDRNDADKQGLLRQRKDESGEPELKERNAKPGKADIVEEPDKSRARGKAVDSKPVDNKKSGTNSDFFSKLEVAPSSAPVQSLGGQSAASSAANMAKSAEGMRQSAFHEAIFSQVEQGLFQKLNDGASQLVLRLDPVDLGQVTLLVSVNQGEVRASLRAENHEAAQALHEQLPRIQALLENQGFKVQKLDVQAQVQDNGQQPGQMNSNSWESLAQHNAGQERHEAMLRQMFNRGEPGKNALAQDMHNMSGDMLSAAEIARITHSNSSMYVVA